MPKQLTVLRLFAALALLCLPCLPGQASVVGQPVPKGTATLPNIRWSASANGGFGAWIIDGTFTTNGSQMAVGGTVDSTSRLSVNPQGTSESGLTVNMPSGATGYALRVLTSTGTQLFSVTANGNVQLNFVNSTATNPSLFGFTTASGTAGQSGRLQVGDANEGIQGGVGERMQLFAFHGIEIFGGRNASPPAFENGSGGGDPSLKVFGSGGANVPLVVQAGASQTADLQDYNTSTNANLAKVDKSGDFITTGYINSPAYQVGGTPGYTGTIPTTAQSLHVSGGIIVGYVNSSGTTVGN